MGFITVLSFVHRELQLCQKGNAVDFSQALFMWQAESEIMLKRNSISIFEIGSSASVTLKS